jgi:hypothetical protein
MSAALWGWDDNTHELWGWLTVSGGPFTFSAMQIFEPGVVSSDVYDASVPIGMCFEAGIVSSDTYEISVTAAVFEPGTASSAVHEAGPGKSDTDC